MSKIIIIIDDGDTFFGLLEDFRNCFFDNANEETIRTWCAEQNMKLEIKVIE